MPIGTVPNTQAIGVADRNTFRDSNTGYATGDGRSIGAAWSVVISLNLTMYVRDGASGVVHFLCSATMASPTAGTNMYIGIRYAGNWAVVAATQTNRVDHQSMSGSYIVNGIPAGVQTFDMGLFCNSFNGSWDTNDGANMTVYQV